ncbi:MAG TPA: ABC transporter permease [Methylosinus sp.]|jgi:putative ABC transport system permease protein|uniref:ABC transporter permease n=1 Tax=Methylosinus sp. TaxID=427 RepID=UPI002F93F0BB
MISSALFEEAIATLRLNALRSALTAIGVIAGVASIVVLGAANGGANKKIHEQLEAMGANSLVTNAIKAEDVGERGPVTFLTDEDAAAIGDHVSGIKYISKEIWTHVTLVAGSKSWTTGSYGVESSFADVFDLEFSEGRFFDEDEVRSSAKVVVLGVTVAEKLFGDESPIDRTLRMGGVPVRVIGVRKKFGFVGGQDHDNVVYVPITMSRSRLPKPQRASPREIDYVNLKVLSGRDRTAVKDEILAALRERKHIKDGEQDRFRVFDASQYVELMNATHSTLSWLLAATAAISLVVGGVGIMNIMLVSVSERTREIGLRRAIGARERDILAQFLAEAIMLCAAAGCIGLALGVAGGYVVSRASDWPLVISAQSVALALVASVGVGIVFGYLPARRAATMDPIDALRRE